MGFQCVPSMISIPEIPSFNTTGDIWRGKGSDEGLISFNSPEWGGHLIVRTSALCYSLVVDGSRLDPVFVDINGFIYWAGNGYVYMTKDSHWVWSSNFPGYEPIEKRVSTDDGIKWEGDEYYTMSTPPSSPDKTVRMAPRGTARNKGAEKEVKCIWPRWVAKKGEFGVYESEDGESGTKIKGLPRFSGGGEVFLRSLNKENGYYRYGRIRRVDPGGKWVIGEIGSPGGWHEGSEPNVNGSVNFRFCKNEGSDATGSSISVSFDSYVCGDETDTAYLGSVSIWR